MPTRIQQMLDLELPIIPAPMAGVQNSASAVSNAGGIGSLPRSGQNDSGCREIPAADPTRELARDWEVFIDVPALAANRTKP